MSRKRTSSSFETPPAAAPQDEDVLYPIVLLDARSRLTRPTPPGHLKRAEAPSLFSSSPEAP